MQILRHIFKDGFKWQGLGVLDNELILVSHPLGYWKIMEKPIIKFHFLALRCPLVECPFVL